MHATTHHSHTPHTAGHASHGHATHRHTPHHARSSHAAAASTAHAARASTHSAASHHASSVETTASKITAAHRIIESHVVAKGVHVGVEIAIEATRVHASTGTTKASAATTAPTTTTEAAAAAAAAAKVTATHVTGATVKAWASGGAVLAVFCSAGGGVLGEGAEGVVGRVGVDDGVLLLARLGTFTAHGVDSVFRGRGCLLRCKLNVCLAGKKRGNKTKD